MGDKTLERVNLAHTHEELHEVFAYDANSGNLYWKIDKGRARRGDNAGTSHNKGYLTVQLDGITYLAHRVVWCMVYGEWPTSFIDHRNLTRSDNRLENLRVATRGENNCNQNIRVDNTSGVKGVCWHERIKKWQVRVQISGKRWHIGYFDALDEAAKAATIARSQQHKEFTNHG